MPKDTEPGQVIEMEFTYRPTHPVKVCSSVVLWSIRRCADISSLCSSRTLSSPCKQPVPVGTRASPPPSPWQLCICFASLALPTLDISCQWNPIMCGLKPLSHTAPPWLPPRGLGTLGRAWVPLKAGGRGMCAHCQDPSSQCRMTESLLWPHWPGALWAQ